MAIQVEVPIGKQTSLAVTPANGNSVFGVQGTFKGIVSLVANFPGADGSVVVLQVSKQGFHGVLTPDPSVTYQIVGALTEGSAKAYFGA